MTEAREMPVELGWFTPQAMALFMLGRMQCPDLVT